MPKRRERGLSEKELEWMRSFAALRMTAQRQGQRKMQSQGQMARLKPATTGGAVGFALALG